MPRSDMEIRELLHFDGQWRSYQKRVLDRADQYLKDNRIHIVAAPGSGKTTLGIELIRRLNAPALILSPSINIRDQWLMRIKEAYLPEKCETKGILSNTMKEPALLNAITYQALHSAIARLGAGEDKDGEDGEGEDYREFDFFAVLEECGIKTLCLDEAHHLRSEWWKALEELVKREPSLTVIALTATPPYDSTKAEWDRYVGLCGPIDEEIIVPELVKEKSLCPHQDYVYFNMPTRAEAEAVTRFRREAQEIGGQILANQEFASLVSRHAGLLNPQEHVEQLLENPEYLSSLLVFLNEKHMPVPTELVRMLGAKGRIPRMNLHWLEVLLQGFLYEDVDSFPSDPVFREQMMELLKSHGLIQRRKVGLSANENVNKLLRASKGKINSIVRIVGEEYRNLGGELRLLILTDYIKKEYLSALGDPEKSVNELGVVPIFENIRRAYEGEGGKAPASGQEGFQGPASPEAGGQRPVSLEAGSQGSVSLEAGGQRPVSPEAGGQLRLAALSGSVVLIPSSARAALEELLTEWGATAAVKECGAAGYCQVSVGGSKVTASALVTELFNRGEIRVLIGTKSLLGEGWDSPCINALILASFVGSFMLSNQMRGRAIRTMAGNPHKVSNIWHLVCMEPKGKGQENQEESEDFITLKRRFEGFLGVHYEEDLIENGLERLSFIRPPYSQKGLEEINQKMLALAADRQALRKRWEDSLVVLDDMEVAVEAGADKEFFKPGALMFQALAFTILSGILMAANLFWLIGTAAASITGGETAARLMTVLSVVAEGLLGAAFAHFVVRLVNLATPFRYMKAIGKGVLCALQQLGSVQKEHVAAEAEDAEGLLCFVYLKGGTEREKDVFAQCVCEMFGVVDNQRYLMKAKGHVGRLCRYYCVPELFGKRREDAQLFVDCLRGYIGPYELCYTRSPQGRRELLEARVHAFANKNERCVDKRKKVKSAWQ